MVTVQKEQCLVNSSNKQYFVNMLSSNLVKNNCKTYLASGDADLLIVQKAVESASAVTYCTGWRGH